MSTSKLQRKVKSMLLAYFPSASVEENTRPSWLTSESGQRLELDFYLPELKAAIEVQGEQHFRYIPFFHKNYSQFLKRKKADFQKKIVCKRSGIELWEINSLTQARIITRELAMRYYSGHVAIVRPRAVEIIFEILHVKRVRKMIKRNLKKLENQSWDEKRHRKKKKKYLDSKSFEFKTKKRELIKELIEITGFSFDPTELDKIVNQGKRGNKAWQSDALLL